MSILLYTYCKTVRYVFIILFSLRLFFPISVVAVTVGCHYPYIYNYGLNNTCPATIFHSYENSQLRTYSMYFQEQSKGDTTTL